MSSIEEKVKLRNRTAEQYKKEKKQAETTAANKVKNIFVKDLAAYLYAGSDGVTKTRARRMASAAMQAGKEYDKKLKGSVKQGKIQAKYPSKGTRK